MLAPQVAKIYIQKTIVIIISLVVYFLGLVWKAVSLGKSLGYEYNTQVGVHNPHCINYFNIKLVIARLLEIYIVPAASIKVIYKTNRLEVKSMPCVCLCPCGCQCFIIKCLPIGNLDACIDSDWLSSPWACFTVRAPSECLSRSVFVIRSASCLASTLQADWSFRQTFDVKESLRYLVCVCVCVCFYTHTHTHPSNIQ